MFKMKKSVLVYLEDEKQIFAYDVSTSEFILTGGHRVHCVIDENVSVQTYLNNVKAEYERLRKE